MRIYQCKLLVFMQLRADVLDVLEEIGAPPPAVAHLGYTSWRAAMPQGAPPATKQQALSGHGTGFMAPAPGPAARPHAPAAVAGTGRAAWAGPRAPAARAAPAHAGAPAPGPAAHGRAPPVLAGTSQGSLGARPALSAPRLARAPLRRSLDCMARNLPALHRQPRVHLLPSMALPPRRPCLHTPEPPRHSPHRARRRRLRSHEEHKQVRRRPRARRLARQRLRGGWRAQAMRLRPRRQRTPRRRQQRPLRLRRI